MKQYKYSLLIVSAFFFVLTGMAQPQLEKKNLSGQAVYKGTELPGKKWTALSLDKDVALASSKDGVLTIKTIDEYVDTQKGWYQTTKDGFILDPTKGYTVEINARINKASGYGSFNIQSAHSDSKGFKLAIYEDSLVDITNSLKPGNILQKNKNNTDAYHRFRYAVTPNNKVHVYRDQEFVGSVDLSSFYSDNMIVDGGFEDRDSSFWMQGSYVTENVHSGKYAMLYQSNWWRSFSYPRVRLKPNTTYTLSFWMKKVEGDFQNIDVKVDQTQILTGSINSTEYSEMKKTFMTSATTEFLYINFPFPGGNFCNFVLDDLSLIEHLPVSDKNAEVKEDFFFFGKSFGRNLTDINIQSVTYDLTGAYAPELYDRNKLGSLIQNGENLIAETSVNLTNGSVPQYAVDRLRKEILSGTEVKENVAATEDELEQACVEMNNANNRFKASVIQDATIKMTAIHFNTETQRIKENSTLLSSLTATMSDGSINNLYTAKIDYRSENPDVATIDKTGKIQALKSGSTTVFVDVILNDVQLSASLPVEVDEYIITEVNFSLCKEKIYVSEAVGSALSILMTGGEILQNEDAKITYSSSNPEIAEVNEFGTIIARAKGNATINVSVEVNGDKMESSQEIVVIQLNNVTIENFPVSYMDEGQQIALAVKGVMSDGSVLDLTSTSQLVIDNKKVNRVNNVGLLEAFLKGTSKLSVYICQGPIEKHIICDLQVGDLSSIETVSNGMSVSFFPNPAEDYIYLKGEKETEMQVGIYSDNGMLLKQITCFGQKSKIDVSSLSAGVYIICMNDGVQKVYSKLLIK